MTSAAGYMGEDGMPDVSTCVLFAPQTLPLRLEIRASIPCEECDWLAQEACGRTCGSGAMLSNSECYHCRGLSLEVSLRRGGMARRSVVPLSNPVLTDSSGETRHGQNKPHQIGTIKRQCCVRVHGW